MHSNRRIYRGIILILLAAVISALIPLGTVPVHSDTAAAELPYSDTAVTEDTREVYFSAEKLSVVVLCARSVTEGALPELSLYTDDGRLIDRAVSEGSSITLQFLPAYTGKYRAVIEYRGKGLSDAEISLDIREYDSLRANKLESIPCSAQYSEDSHKTTDAADLYGHITEEADGYTVSMFSVPRSAGGIFSYKLTSADGYAEARLYSYDGGMYRAHPSHRADGSTAGDAQQLAYSEDSYLLVYSRGEFTLEADLLEMIQPEPTPISLPYAGALDVSGGVQIYDSAAFGRLLAEHPYADIDNPYVRMYEISASASSVVSLLCERREHAGLSLVSAEHGLSARSEYPLREFGSYCSEIYPTDLCYESVLCDSGRLYLVYTGSAESAYIELTSAPSHAAETEYLSEYNKSDIIPRVSLGSVYSDSQIYERLGVVPFDIEMTRITGYVIEAEDNTRYYYGTADEITPPYKKGECRMWVTLTSIGEDGEGNRVTAEHRLLLCTFETTGVIIIPSIDEMIDSIKNGEPISALYILLMLSPIAVSAIIAVIIVKRRRKKKAKTAETVRRPRPRRTPDIPTKTEEEVAECSDCSSQEENASSKG